MTVATQTAARSRMLQLHHGADDSTADRLRNQVNSAKLVRVRRGCFLAAPAWLRSPPWERHLITCLAVGMTTPGVIFCRETALALHGVPLLRTPQAVHLRTHSNSQSGRRRSAAITGAAPRAALVKIWQATFGEDPAGQGWLRRFTGVDTKRVQYPRPLRAGVRSGLDPRAEAAYQRAVKHLEPPLLTHVHPPAVQLRTESLALSVVDTVCHAEFAAAVVILDAVLAGRHTGPMVESDALESWLPCAPSARAQDRWERALAFADPLAESAGESLSRVRIAQAGFQVPRLQYTITVADGKRYRTDFYWPEAKIVGEFDGAMKYTRARALQGAEPAEVVVQEKNRERRIEQQGYRVVRWDWNDLRSPDALRRILSDYGVPRAR